MAEEAEKRKLERYGEGLGGVKVPPAACESRGRLGPSFDELLRQLEAEVRQADASTGAAVGRRWRAELGIALVRAQHVAFAQAVRTGGVLAHLWAGRPVTGAASGPAATPVAAIAEAAGAAAAIAEAAGAVPAAASAEAAGARVVAGADASTAAAAAAAAGAGGSSGSSSGSSSSSSA